jgi:hypothetical protein
MVLCAKAFPFIFLASKGVMDFPSPLFSSKCPNDVSKGVPTRLVLLQQKVFPKSRLVGKKKVFGILW